MARPEALQSWIPLLEPNGGQCPQLCPRSRDESLHAWVHEGEVLEHALVHAVDERAVSQGQAWPLTQELLVKVAAVARGLLSLVQGEQGSGSGSGQMLLCVHV